MLRFTLVLLGGCSLYFKEPPQHDPPSVELVDAAVLGPDASTCPKPGTHAEILYPLDGATNVSQPVPIRTHVVIPNTLDGKGAWLTDANGQAVALSHYDADCSVDITNTGPAQDESWTACYTGLAPDTQYTWSVVLTCYDPSGPHELAMSTFHTAP